MASVRHLPMEHLEAPEMRRHRVSEQLDKESSNEEEDAAGNNCHMYGASGELRPGAFVGASPLLSEPVASPSNDGGSEAAWSPSSSPPPSSSQRCRGAPAEKALAAAALRDGRLLHAGGCSSANQLYLHPESPFRLGWDFSALVLILLLAVVVPLEVCLWKSDEPEPPFYTTVDVVTYIFFSIDIFLNFFTAYHEGHGIDSRLITAVPAMAGAYLQGWFAMDFIATFPWFEVVQLFVSDSTSVGARALRFSKVLRMVKVLRVLKLGGLVQVMEESLVAQHSTTVAFQFYKLSGIVLIFLHNVACAWCALARYQEEGTRTWLHPLSLNDETRIRQYIAAFYFAVMTGTSVGFGDITPQNTRERTVTTVLLLLSVCLVGHFLKRFTMMVSSLRKLQHEKATAKQEAIIFMKKRNVPRELQMKVLRHIENVHDEEAITALDDRLMGHLSAFLRDELAMAVKSGVLRQCPFFRDAQAEFLAEVCQVCRTRRVAMGDVIAREDQPAAEMFWLVRGEAVVMRRQLQIGCLVSGDWFGELSLFAVGAVRTATIRCSAPCEFLVLSQKDFQRKVAFFPQVRAECDSIAKGIQQGNPPSLHRPAVPVNLLVRGRPVASAGQAKR